ncbi:MAG: hypothetical protein AB7Q23_01445 [Hyphomonadaceae bacterium]
MPLADWRALIEAYLDGRISADGFARRFNEAWIAQANARVGAHPALSGLFGAVEQFSESDPESANDDDMRQAAQRALAELGEEPAIAPHTFDRTRAREEMRRFQVHMTGCAGVGCLLVLVWVALCVLQINFVIEWIHANVIPNVWLSSVVGFFLAFVPIVGNVLAFLGATAAGWATWLAALVFFAAPAVTLFSGWSRWRRQGR